MDILRNKIDLEKITAEFDVPKLIFDKAVDAGPDEAIYYMRDEKGINYVVWARDYMGTMAEEDFGLRHNFDVDVEVWFELKNADDYEENDDMRYRFYYEGDWYIVGVLSGQEKFWNPPY